MFVNFKSKRRMTTMTYNKPELVMLSSAVHAIQQIDKTATSLVFDSSVQAYRTFTPNAYEADE